ncbi:MAG: hypothetical protein EOP84_24460, partial [Verrucomicrobiaceae bacterium]
YVHRIGRTGRAGRSGQAISFVAGREIYKMQQIMRFTKGRIRREVVPTLDVVEEKRAAALVTQVRDTLEKAEYKKQDAIVDRLLEDGHTATDIASALLHLLGAEQARPAERIPEDSPQGGRREYPQYGARPGQGRSEAPSEGRYQGARTPAREGGDFAWSAELGDRSRPARERDYSRDVEPSRTSHEAGMVRLALNTGREHGIMAGDIVGVIAGVTRLPREVIGAIKLLPRQTLVDVSEDHAGDILEKLNGVKFKGYKLMAMKATDVGAEFEAPGRSEGRHFAARRPGFGRTAGRPSTRRHS